MVLTAEMAAGETRGDRILRVDHAGEHGAVCVYAAQARIARWRSPGAVAGIEHCLAHERRHRALFAAEIARRGQRWCWSYAPCGVLGTTLGVVTGLLGPSAIAAATLGIERVVLCHLEDQMAKLATIDPAAVVVIAQIVAEEREHRDNASREVRGLAAWLIAPLVSAATEAVIWIGMRRPL
ncbi:demethoxyubiquinone hydroxylase family protein [Sphingomonas sp.]|uniref:demethoxyubiquinone hydroxylase family protein n=1 Tax=Sphingomonas sp. TaxID=28214 RepID=UPI001B1186D3|nr:demethoxyubiquinone hydroxylase family protein [Sphingomonas sp.]MBO9713659.1 demethoxyubiquinone hydroxylase family protein [Sphingomonas sp.]